MSDGPRIPFERAFELVARIAAELRPHVVRVKAAGSLRRRQPEVGDLELVVEPRLVPVDLLGALGPDAASVRAVLGRYGRLAKGGDRYVQVVDVAGVPGLKLDCFLVSPPAQWGSILAIRTGPAALGKWAVTRMHDRGLRHLDGRVMRVDTGETVPTPTEADFFAAAGLPCLPPAQRHTRAAYAPLPNAPAPPAEVKA